MVWFCSKKKENEEDKCSETFSFVIQCQKAITIFLIGVFTIVLAYMMFYPDANQGLVNSFLPIITGWMGVVIGFFFSREISGIFEDKLKAISKDSLQKIKNELKALSEEVEEPKKETKELTFDDDLLNDIMQNLIKKEKKKK